VKGSGRVSLLNIRKERDIYGISTVYKAGVAPLWHTIYNMVFTAFL
jgi:uncharacterized membrane protein